MQVPRMAAALFSLTLAAPSFAEDWIEYVDRAEHFAVSIPGRPVARDTTYVGQKEEMLPARIYTVDEGPRHYSVTVVNYAGVDVTEVRGSIAWAAWNFRRRGGEVTYDAYAQVDRIEGHHLHITNADTTRTMIAIHLHARRLYILEGTVPASSPPPLVFQQSLQILDEDGQRIRYEIDADGNRLNRVR